MRKALLEQKNLLNPEEAIRHFGLSQRKFYRWLEESHSFVAFYGKRKLILRTELEQYFRQYPEEKEALKRGRRKKA